MSINVRTASMPIRPKAYTNDKGRTYCSADVIEPVSYDIEFSPEAGNDPKQLEALFIDAAEKGEEIEINFSQKKGRFGTAFVVYDIKAQKGAPAAANKS